ncbi:peptidoglycan DD-metalloendopeptidase family protein [Bacillaceae bacterium W0354]
MNEKERKVFRQSKWKRLTRQRWFYPTMYITLVAVILAAVMIYQFNSTDNTAVDDNVDVNWDGIVQPDTSDKDDAVPVVAEQEDLVMPTLLGDDAEIITKFYDPNASTEEQEDALVFYNNQYSQSKGVDITSSNGEPFEVIAALSGTVTKVEEDDLLGQTVEIEHDGERVTFYASLSEVSVAEGDEVSQGDTIGMSGSNVYGDPEVTKVHFRLIEDGTPVNPNFN